MTDAEAYKGPATWRIVLAALLDFITAFFGIGYILASIFGGKTETGFNLQGGPALLFLILLVAYFLVFNKYLGGTIWKRILRAQR